MLTLAVDAAAEIGSIALVDESGVCEEVRLEASAGYGQVLFGELEGLLARQHVRLADIDLFAASSGPGSFTGVRVGLAAVKGLAEVMGKPAAGISNLVALAAYGTAELRAPIIDARRGEIFAALLDKDGAEILPASVLTVAAFVELAGNRKAEFISAGFDPGFPVTRAPALLSGMIGRLAMERFLAGVQCEPAAMEANYVRRSDAEMLWKP